MSRRTALIVLAVLVAAGIALPPVLLLALVPLWFLGADLRVAVGAAAVIVLVEAVWATNATAPVAMAVLCAGVITGARFQRLRRGSAARERQSIAEPTATRAG